MENYKKYKINKLQMKLKMKYMVAYKENQYWKGVGCSNEEEAKEVTRRLLKKGIPAKIMIERY